MSDPKQTSDKENENPFNIKNVKQGYPTSIPGNIKPAGNSTNGGSQSSSRGKQGDK